ncbi:MAG: redox-active disulfide protein 2 [Bacteroidetes bacterium]|jgi:small redox-active disulfide protein 2|nr:redox-active disulfide protein 2 [Bacteroidota bacterium]
MDIQVLGTGCAKCKALENATREAVLAGNIDATITKVEDITRIMQVTMTTPALVVDGKVVVKGRVPSQTELINMLKNK